MRPTSADSQLFTKLVTSVHADGMDVAQSDVIYLLPIV